MDNDAILAAEIENCPSIFKLASIFRRDGYSVDQGRYSIRLSDFEHFVFRDMDAKTRTATISADHHSAKELAAFATRVSQTLAKTGIRHRFEVYAGPGTLVAYLHHDWPQNIEP